MYTNLMGRGWNEVWGRGDGNETLNILNQSREGKKGERERTATQIGREWDGIFKPQYIGDYSN